MKTTYQNLRDRIKTAVRGKLISVHIQTPETSQKNNLTMHLKILEKEEAKKKCRCSQKIINIMKKSVI